MPYTVIDSQVKNGICLFQKRQMPLKKDKCHHDFLFFLFMAFVFSKKTNTNANAIHSDRFPSKKWHLSFLKTTNAIEKRQMPSRFFCFSFSWHLFFSKKTNTNANAIHSDRFPSKKWHLSFSKKTNAIKKDKCHHDFLFFF